MKSTRPIKSCTPASDEERQTVLAISALLDEAFKDLKPTDNYTHDELVARINEAAKKLKKAAED